MNPFDILQGNALEVLPALPSESVHCCVTSPPYWGLRTYGTEPQIWGGDPACGHQFGEVSPHGGRGQSCLRCAAWRGELCLEPTPDLYVAHITAIFREARRVLRSDGTLWLNLGDSYARDTAKGRHKAGQSGKHEYIVAHNQGRVANQSDLSRAGLKPKNLCGIPWRVALALQADGWFLRSDVIWAKLNPMPESVTDRPTRSHEYLFLLTKAERYFYDALAIAEPLARANEAARKTPAKFGGAHKYEGAGRQSRLHSGNEYRGTLTMTRNRRSVWPIATEPYAEAHFATYPTALVEPCVKAGTSERGCCPRCGTPCRRVALKTSVRPMAPYGGKWRVAEPQAAARRMLANVRARRRAGEAHDHPFPPPRTLGWLPTCAHGDDPVPSTVLDPFCGSGATGVVALRLGRRFVGIDLNPSYVAMARRRIANDAPLLNIPPNESAAV